jgi:YggT family protein
MDRFDAKYYLDRAINFFVGLIVVILGLRILFRLFDANPSAGFVQWIYDTSEVLMAPFRGIFPPAAVERGVVLDVSAIFAAIMYVILGLLLLALIAMIPGDDHTEDEPVDERPSRRRSTRRR